MTIRRIACLMVLLALAGGPVEARDSRWSADQTSVWNEVQARWQAWQHDDFDAYLAAHHETWHRWAPRSEGLENKDDVEGFWQRAKAQEETVAFTLKPAAIETYDSGRLAAVHYVADETVRLRKARQTRDGRVIPVGQETHIPIRFSDFYVREGGEWRFIGGYRDGNCSLFRGFGVLCAE